MVCKHSSQLGAGPPSSDYSSSCCNQTAKPPLIRHSAAAALPNLDLPPMLPSRFLDVTDGMGMVPPAMLSAATDEPPKGSAALRALAASAAGSETTVGGMVYARSPLTSAVSMRSISRMSVSCSPSRTSACAAGKT
jgi:hypothetical protein